MDPRDAQDELSRLRARAAALETELAAAKDSLSAAVNDARHWRRIVESLPEFVCIFDAQGRFVYLNYIGPEYQGEDYVGRSLGQWIEPHYWQAAFASALAGERTQYEAYDAQRQHWFRCNAGPVTLDDGETYILVVSQSIDDLKRAERELRDSRELWESLVANSPDIILLLQPDSTVLFINKTSPGYTQADVVGRLGTEFVESPYREALTAAIERASETRQPQWFEMQDERTRLWWHVTLVPVCNSERGDLVLAISQDMTARKSAEEELRRARDELELRVNERTAELDAANRQLREDIAQREIVERQLRESEERFRAIADTVPVAIVITRLADGTIVYANQRLARLFNMSAEAFLGRKSTEFYVEPQQREGLMSRLQETQAVLDLELWVQTPQGNQLLVSGSYQPIIFDGQSCVLTGFIDLTKRIETEQALLAERRLLKRLLELHERDRQLISYEVHDGIVQDMTASLMFFESSRAGEFLEDASAQSSFASGVRLLRGSIDEARRLINGLRPPVLEDEGVVAAIVSLVDEIERDSNIAIELVVDVKFHRLAPALEMAIYRIVQEGLNNVWHHSRSPKARVELVQRDDTIEIRVQDWGVGFDPAKVSKRRYGLTGMRERARLLNGRAIVKSSPGQGATLHIELPLIDALMPSAE